jgi:hypothetical protein
MLGLLSAFQKISWEKEKVDQAQLSCTAVKNFNYSNMLVLRFNLSVRIPLSTIGIYHAHKAI